MVLLTEILWEEPSFTKVNLHTHTISISITFVIDQPRIKIYNWIYWQKGVKYGFFENLI